MTSELVPASDWAGYFALLGRETERRLTASGDVDDGFPDVAAAVLAEVPPPVSPNWTSLLEDVVAGRAVLPDQEDPSAVFGEPPLTLFRSDKFFVSALYWLDGTTTIHQHAFSGAFRVVRGSSLHVPYTFDLREAVSDQLRLGALVMEVPEILRCGDVRPIRHGDALIHSLFHLDRPSVTAVIRTYGDRTPQPNYLKPGIAFDAFLQDDLLGRRFQSLLSLCTMDPTAAWRAATAFLEQEDLGAGFLLLMRWAQRVDQGESLSDLVSVMERRHGGVVEELKSALSDLLRSFSVTMRRRMVHDPEQRLFLALLLNLPDAASIRGVLRQIYPEREPGGVLAEWVTNLSHPQNRAVSGISLPADSVKRLAGALRTGDPTALRVASTGVRPPELLAPLFT